MIRIRRRLAGILATGVAVTAISVGMAAPASASTCPPTAFAFVSYGKLGFSTFSGTLSGSFVSGGQQGCQYRGTYTSYNPITGGSYFSSGTYTKYQPL